MPESELLNTPIFVFIILLQFLLISMNNLFDLGFNQVLKEYIEKNNLNEFSIGRVAQQHKDSYIVITEEGSKRAVITGNLRYGALAKTDLPVVGDWVLLIASDDLYLIYQVLPRHSRLERQAVQSLSESQLIATNIDQALIVQSVDQNFNLNRLERYVTICYAGDIEPVAVLNKIDLLTKSELEALVKKIEERLPNIPLLVSTTVVDDGARDLLKGLEPRKTYCLVGSSGVGKSSLINAMKRQNLMKIAEISDMHQKGKHTTTHRELIILDNGAMVIDTPGMRELGVLEDGDSISQTFDQIDMLSESCRFADCSHTNEPGCAVLKAIEEGELDASSLKNFKKLQRESKRVESTKAEKRKRDKGFGKMYKEVMKMRNKRRF